MGHYHGCVQETLMRSHDNLRSKVGDHQMQAFWDILDECGFMNLDFWHKHYLNFTV